MRAHAAEAAVAAAAVVDYCFVAAAVVVAADDAFGPFLTSLASQYLHEAKQRNRVAGVSQHLEHHQWNLKDRPSQDSYSDYSEAFSAFCFHHWEGMSNFVVQAKAVAGVVVASGADERAEEQLGCKVLAAEVAQSEVDPIP